MNRTYDPCKNCPNKPDLSNGPIIGDTPCDWCDKNPYKVTCLKNESIISLA